ncbi:MAG TPA: hypothetical protein VEJ18_00930 [Planctomycetota bacterium]|nr:hypothetical protein [Planctomycetota bacterium]
MPKATKPETKETIEVIERFDPAEQAEIDGDPTFEMKLDPDSVPADQFPVWVHHSDEAMYKARGYREVRYGASNDGIEMLSGLTFDEGARMTYADHVLYVRDKERHERITANERKRNRDLRARFIKGANKTIYVNTPGDGPREMARR